MTASDKRLRRNLQPGILHQDGKMRRRTLWAWTSAFLTSHRVLLGAILVFAVALTLRTVNLESWPRWYADEGINGIASEYYFHWHNLWYYDLGFNSPFMPWFSGLMATIFGKSYFVLRFSGALLGATSCVLLYLIAGKLYNRRVGMAAGLMLAIATTYINRVALMWNFAEFFLLASIFCYLKFRDNGKKRWSYPLGALLGLGFLSSYSAIAIVIFIAVQSLLDRNFSKIRGGWLAFAVLCLPYVIVVFSMGWNNFYTSTFLSARAGAPDMAGLLQFLLMGRPDSQLAWSETLRFNIWSTLGFLSCLYLLGRNKQSDRFLLTTLVCIIFIWVLIGERFWWGHMAYFYPILCIAIAVVLGDIISGKSNSWLLGLFAIFLTLPLFTYGHLRPSFPTGAGRHLFIWIFGIMGLILLVASFRIWRKKMPHDYESIHLNRFAGIIVCILLLFIVLSSAAYDLRNIATDQAADQKATVEFLNTHVGEGDLVAAATPIMYLLGDDVGVRYTDVAFYTTRVEWGKWTLKRMLPRYKADISLDKMRYFVLDSPFSGGLREWAAALVPVLESTWKPVATFGDYTIYENPGHNLVTVPLADDDQYTKGLWTVGKLPNTGDYTSLSDDPAVKTSGKNSLKIDFGLSGNNAIYYIAPPQNWLDYAAISFQWDGDQTGAISFDILAPDWNNFFHKSFPDNQTGWKKVFIGLDGMTIQGHPSWDKVKKIAIKFQSLPTSGTVHLDELNLYKIKEGN